MIDEQRIEELLEPSTVLSHALDFMQSDLDADKYSAISAWVARVIHEIKEDLAKFQGMDQEGLEGLAVTRRAFEAGKLWLRIFEEIQGAITPYGSGWHP
jgi:hypothetical protein